MKRIDNMLCGLNLSIYLIMLFSVVGCKGESSPIQKSKVAESQSGQPESSPAPSSPTASEKADSQITRQGFPTPHFALPAARDALMAMLSEKNPNKRAAIRGAIRKLDNIASLDFSHVSVVGASLSAGFAGTPLANAFDDAITLPHKVANLASTFFFKAPWTKGSEHIDQTLASKATLVVAVDILFWYAYIQASPEERQRSLARGLKNLERIKAPVLVGDLPNMRNGQPWMLPPASVPSPAELTALNVQIYSWAEQHINVHIVPLAQWSAALVSDGEVVVQFGGVPVPAGDLMNTDGLHPNSKGVRYMLARMAVGLRLAFPDTPAKALNL